MPPAGYAIKRNPGVTALWITSNFTLFFDDDRRPLITVGPAIEVEWFAEGRTATRAEVEESVTSGKPLLEAQARIQQGAMEELEQQYQAARALFPKI